MSSELGKMVGERIRIQRKRINLSQEELAFKSSFSTSFISDVERARKSPSLDSLVRITSALGISLEELFRGTQTLETSTESTLLQTITTKIQPLNHEELKSVDEMIELLLNFKHK